MSEYILFFYKINWPFSFQIKTIKFSILFFIEIIIIGKTKWTLIIIKVFFYLFRILLEKTFFFIKIYLNYEVFDFQSKFNSISQIKKKEQSDNY